MFKIVRTPSLLKPFFRSLTTEFHWDHAQYFTQLVLAMTVSWGKHNLSNLYRHLPAATHRTRFNQFLHSVRWDPHKLLQKAAYDLLGRMKLPRGSTVFLIIDDSHKAKRGKAMDAVQKFYDAVSKTVLRGHQYTCAILQAGDVTIPWGIRLYAGRDVCRKLRQPFLKCTESAAQLIREFSPSRGIRVLVLFDSYYLCRPVVQACRERGFRFVSVVKGNRNLFAGGRKLKTRKYVPRRWQRSSHIRVNAGSSSYLVADAGWLDLAGVGKIHLVCSRRVGETRTLALATDAPGLSARQIVCLYARRWMIEQFFKDAKQLLGLGQYQNGSYKAAVTHLHLVCFAHVLLTHLSLRRRDDGAKGKRRGKAGVSLSTASMQNELRRMVFLDVVQYLKETCHSGDSFVKELQRLWVA